MLLMWQMIRDVCVWKKSVLSSIHTTHCTCIYSLKDISSGRYYQLSTLGILLCKKDAEFRMIKFPVKLIVSVHWSSWTISFIIELWNILPSLDTCVTSFWHPHMRDYCKKKCVYRPIFEYQNYLLLFSNIC